MSPINLHAPSRDSEQALRQAIANYPDDARAHAALASLLCAAGRVGEALAHIDRETDRHPSKIWPLSIKAGIFSSERRANEALDVHRRMVAMAPEVPLLWANFGSDLAAVGDVEEATAAFRRAVELAPDHGTGWLGLVNLATAQLDTVDIEAMEKGITRSRDPFQKIQLLFALGRTYGARGALDRSFEKFSEGNILRETVAPYDGAGLAAFVEAHKALGECFFAATGTTLTPGSGAIFIVGMPRSGSTLVEQILASHPDVEGMGELFALRDVASSIGAFDAPDSFVQRLKTLTHAEAAQLGARYLAATRRYRQTERPYFTDKMPANWRFIALIHRILPGARIIDVRRDPLACCFSAFATYFNRHTDFPNALEDLGRYYRLYTAMLETVQKLAPDKLHCIEHAQLVSNAEREIRALLGFLALPFSPSCLKPEENSRAIYTPSAQQVRAPIRRDDDRSVAYLPWLKPLKAALDAE